MLTLILWAATLPLLPYVLLKKKHDLFCALVVAFGFLSIGVMIQIEIPNPDHTIWVPVVAP